LFAGEDASQAAKSGSPGHHLRRLYWSLGHAFQLTFTIVPAAAGLLVEVA
jgi:hypothetical protein